MKSLTQFEKFDIEAFLKDKLLVFVDEQDYQKYEDGSPAGREGIRVELLIMKDETEYKNGKTKDNLYEKLFVKVPTAKSTIGLSLNQPVRLINVSKASVYGNYRNQLSITAENVIAISNNNGK